MLRTLDRYVLREVAPPFVLAVLVFTFLLIVQPLMEQAEALLAKGVPLLTVAHLLLTLVPQALGIAIPIATLVGLLIGFGRLSADREMVAFLACGVSLYRVLRPVAAFAVAATIVTGYVMIAAIPDANQTFREITYNVLAERAQHDVKPQVFFEDFPGKVLYVRDIPESGEGWTNVFVADTSRPGWPTVFVAEHGSLLLDRAARRVDLVLERGARHTEDQVLEFGSQIIGLDPESVFPRGGPQRGINELTIPDLRAQIQLKESQGLPVHNEIMALEQKFSIPVACVVFGLLGLALGVTSRREAKMAGFVLGLGVVFLYWALMYLSEALTKGQMFPAHLSRWVANIVLGPLGVVALIWRARWAEGWIPFQRLLARMPWIGRTPELAPAPIADSRRRDVRVRLVLRVPRVGLPAPNILDRYVSMRFVRVLALTFVGLLGIIYIATFVDLSDKLFKGQTTTRMLLAYFWYSTPQFTYYALPLAILIGTLVTIGLLTKTSELTVMKACGISLYRAATPLLAVALLASGLLFGLQETILAAANQRADAIGRTIRGRPPRATFNPANPNWLVGQDGTIYHYTLYDPDRRQLIGLSTYEFDRSGHQLARETAIDRADYRDARWVAVKGWSRTYRGPGSKLASETEHFTDRQVVLEAPDYFETERQSAEMMTFRQLNHYVDELRMSGFNVVRYRVDLQRKVAFPFVALIMGLLAVPFAVTTGRRGALFGIGLGIVLAMAYWLLTSLFAAIGTAGLLTPALAAWAPNLLFGAGAIYLILTVRT